ncbi:hypothetical protein M433DRAFT_157137 [Acidomyces richmondensis BFW]|nr:MAG: hypothetical protein FE78DRAFT_94297 [Acidomyces sp. 'richmondensis']KYG43088.1 hypothetical protein M433DRAFT_157137 [Acidomyces richmondensis BFW]
MASSSEKEKAVLTELFGYTPLTLLDDIINTVNEVNYQALNAIEEGLKQQPATQLGFQLTEEENKSLNSAEDKQAALEKKKHDEIDNGMVKLETLLNSTVDKDFDKFEIYALRNILTIGGDTDPDLVDYITLDHYKNLDLSTAEKAPTKEEVGMQERRLRELKKLNILLKVKEVEQANILRAIKSVEEKLRFLTKKSEEVEYITAQLPQLRELLAELKAAQGKIGSSYTSAKEQERQAYIDAQSRRAMERVGVQASSRASGWARKTRDDIEGIEAVNQAFGGAPQ